MAYSLLGAQYCTYVPDGEGGEGGYIYFDHRASATESKTDFQKMWIRNMQRQLAKSLRSRLSKQYRKKQVEGGARQGVPASGGRRPLTASSFIRERFT